MDAVTGGEGVRVDAWTWAVRVYPTRSSAAAACRAGHVKVGGVNAKPATTVRVGDTVRARTPAGERVLVVRGLLVKRVSARGAEQFDDLTTTAGGARRGACGGQAAHQARLPHYRPAARLFPPGPDVGLDRVLLRQPATLWL
jgi:ribosomal 50S subunit-recycling heat shock protein